MGTEENIENSPKICHKNINSVWGDIVKKSNYLHLIPCFHTFKLVRAPRTGISSTGCVNIRKFRKSPENWFHVRKKHFQTHVATQPRKRSSENVSITKFESFRPIVNNFRLGTRLKIGKRLYKPWGRWNPTRPVPCLFVNMTGRLTFVFLTEWRTCVSVKFQCNGDYNSSCLENIFLRPTRDEFVEQTAAFVRTLRISFGR